MCLWGCLCLQITTCRPSVALLPADPNHTISAQHAKNSRRAAACPAKRKHISQHDRLLTQRTTSSRGLSATPDDHQLLSRTLAPRNSRLHKIKRSQRSLLGFTSSPILPRFPRTSNFSVSLTWSWTPKWWFSHFRSWITLKSNEVFFPPRTRFVLPH